MNDVPAPRVLMIATAADWQGTARTPGALAAAGFEPYLFAPEGSYARFSRHTKAHYLLDARAPFAAQATTIATAFDRLRPSLAVACDDGAFDLMRGIHDSPQSGVPQAVHDGLRRLIAVSLGDPAGYAASVDKLQFALRARELGLDAPQSIVTHDVAEAATFAAHAGYPVVLKRSFSFGGHGVAVCADANELAGQFARLAAGADAPTRLLVQQHVPGTTWYVHALAWKGELLCSHAVEKLEGIPRGPATVVRYSHHPVMSDITARVARAFGISGLFGTEFLATDRAATPWLIEANRRITPGSHRGPAIGIDYVGALRDALENRPLRTRRQLDAGEDHVFVRFPMEWTRDPQSPWLVYHRGDVPHDDPRLAAALFDFGWKVNKLRTPS